MIMTVFQGLKEINVSQYQHFVIIFIGIFLIEKCQQRIQRWKLHAHPSILVDQGNHQSENSKRGAHASRDHIGL